MGSDLSNEKPGRTSIHHVEQIEGVQYHRPAAMQLGVSTGCVIAAIVCVWDTSCFSGCTPSDTDTTIP